jgi:hypothetical protein
MLLSGSEGAEGDDLVAPWGKERKGKSWREDLRAREGERDERGQMTFKIPSEERRDEGRTEVTLTE